SQRGEAFAIVADKMAEAGAPPRVYIDPKKPVDLPWEIKVLKASEVQKRGNKDFDRWVSWSASVIIEAVKIARSKGISPKEIEIYQETGRSEEARERYREHLQDTWEKLYENAKRVAKAEGLDFGEIYKTLVALLDGSVVRINGQPFVSNKPEENSYCKEQYRR